MPLNSIFRPILSLDWVKWIRRPLHCINIVVLSRIYFQFVGNIEVGFFSLMKRYSLCVWSSVLIACSQYLEVYPSTQGDGCWLTSVWADVSSCQFCCVGWHVSGVCISGWIFSVVKRHVLAMVIGFVFDCEFGVSWYCRWLVFFCLNCLLSRWWLVFFQT